jgi:hypothetical protein
MVIGPIAASRGNEREVVGTGSLLEVREDQRSAAIAILPGASPLYRTEALLAPNSSLAILPLAADLGGRWTPLSRKRPQTTVTIVMTVRAAEEAACSSRFLGDGHHGGDR